jgi:ribonuclease-3
MSGSSQVNNPGGTDVVHTASSGAPDNPDPRLALADRIGYDFVDQAVLLLACTHRSWCAEHAGDASNERLEFLGDAVLGLVVTDHLFSAHPELPEGELAKLRSTVVSAAALAQVGAELDLGQAMRLGKGEAASGGRTKASILADGLEAVFGAVYVDGGIDAARTVILALLAGRLDVAATGVPGGHDHKTQLQELVAHRFEVHPEYRVRNEGPDHDKRFFAEVLVAGEVCGTGEGRTKKLSEQEAARAAWITFTSGRGTGDA